MELKMSENVVKNLSNEEIHDFVSTGCSVIDIYSKNCVPCKKMEPEFTKFSSTLKCAKAAKVSADECSSFLSEIGIRGLPAFVVFIDGKMAFMKTGFMRASDMEEAMRSCSATSKA
jgi:thioredoxin-like negative regulator of GroEL